MQESIPTDCGYDKIFKHVVDTGHLGLNISWTQFMTENCKGKWGWYWAEDSMTCKVSFEDAKEATWFALNYSFDEKEI